MGGIELTPLGIDGVKKLTRLLAACFDTLRIYGKEPEQLQNVNRIFQMILSKYEFPEIRTAFATYLTTRFEMPTPADIVTIIEAERAKRTPSEFEILIGKLGTANHRRSIGVPRKAEPDTYERLEEWEAKNGPVTWTSFEEWELSQKEQKADSNKNKDSNPG